jgi:hypothetical protein
MDRTQPTSQPSAETLTVEVGSDEYIALEREAAGRDQPTEAIASEHLSKHLHNSNTDSEYFQTANLITVTGFYAVVYAYIINQHHIAGAPDLSINLAPLLELSLAVSCMAYSAAAVADTVDLQTLKNAIPNLGGNP